MSRSRVLPFAAVSLLFLGFSALPAHAVNKDMVQLQTQVQQLQDAVARLQQSNDENMGVLKDLVQQNSDAVNKMTVTMNSLTLKMQNQQDAISAKSDTLSGQIQSLNDSLDELKARMDRLQQALTAIQSQQQSISGALNNLPQNTGTPTAAPGSAPADTTTPPTSQQPTIAPPDGSYPPQASTGNGGDALPPTSSVIAPIAAAAPSAPPVGDLYRQAYGDYISARYPLATSEFQQLAQAYPDDNLSGNAYFYMGEIDLRTQKPTAAVKMYNHVIEHFPDNVKIPAAQLHKAEAMIAMHQDEGAARELHALIQRYPNSPEAATARAKLNTLARR